jgi:uncharacterized protein YjbJ (UPF0337 family)
MAKERLFLCLLACEQGEELMIWEQIEGNWHRVKGKFKEKWNDFTDDDWEEIQGRREQLVGKLMSKYSMSREEAERQADQFGGGITFH